VSSSPLTRSPDLPPGGGEENHDAPDAREPKRDPLPRPGWGVSGRALVIVASALCAAPAAAQQLPVVVDAEPLFGEGTLAPAGWSAVLVQVENLTRDDRRGELHLSVESMTDASMRREVPFDVPGRQTRRAILRVFTGQAGSPIRVRYMVDGRSLGSATLSTDYMPAQQTVVVFSDPPRLRGALLDLEAGDIGSYGARRVRFPIGSVRFDPATADPMLPESAGGWSTVGVLVASGPALSRASSTQRAAIADWLRTGGELLIFPRSEADLRQEAVTELAGTLEVGGEPAPASVLTPASGPRLALRCGAEHRAEIFGCSRRVGAGRVYVASYDGEAPHAIESGAPRRLVAALLEHDDAGRPALPWARGVDALDREYWRSAGSFGTLRSTLDPNEGFRPALALVAVVLFLYVLLVGPLNFRWIGKHGRPTLALLTTPLLASACVFVLLAVGYVGKGVTMRYRRFELVEAVEGQARVPARRYTGLFSTRPGTFELPGGGPDALTRRIGGGSGRGPAHRVEGGETRLVDFRAGLWETTFLREDRLIDLGGAIEFEGDGLRLAAVRNGSDQALRGAIVVDTAALIYRVGDVPAGGRAPIAQTSSATLPNGYLTAPDSPAHETVARHTTAGGDLDAETAQVRALIHLLGDAFVPRDAPVLYARLDASEASIGGVFSAERDERWIRVQPVTEGSAVGPAYLPPPDATDPFVPPPVPTELPPDPAPTPGPDGGAP